MAPIVLQLDDDNCDGKVDGRDIPEIVFTSFAQMGAGFSASNAYQSNGTLHAVSVVNGAMVEKWTVPADGTLAVRPNAYLAGGNIDGQPGNEVVALVGHLPLAAVPPATTGTAVPGSWARAYRADGSVLWTTQLTYLSAFLTIADLDGDGSAEVIAGGLQVLDGATGAIRFSLPNVAGSSTELVVADVTGDGVPELVTPSRVYSNRGVELADLQASPTGAAADMPPRGNWVAVADLNRDGKPEIISVRTGVSSLHPTDAAHAHDHSLAIWNYDATVSSGHAVLLRSKLDVNGGTPLSACAAGTTGGPIQWSDATNSYLRGGTGGGPVTVADYNGDGYPDIGVAGGTGYTVYSGEGVLAAPQVSVGQSTGGLLWTRPTHDCSSAATGSSVFDFDGDGRAEVVYSDEYYLRIYDGATGVERFRTCNTTGTLSEYPVVADVDNDGHADIVAVSNAYALTCPAEPGAASGTKQAGVRIFGDKEGKWVRTRRVWNQHNYHVTNVAEDGTIPRNPSDNWLVAGLNNFRQNSAPGGQFAAPDLVAEVDAGCHSVGQVLVHVRNLGEAEVDDLISVSLYDATTRALLGTKVTSHALYPVESEDLMFDVPQDVARVYAVVAGDGSAHAWHECRTDNNRSPEVQPNRSCGGVN